MAAISNIRKRSGLLIFVIALAMVAFLLMDAFNSNSSLFTGNTNTLAEVNGQEIPYQEFAAEYQKEIDLWKVTNRTNAVDQQTLNTIRQQTWDRFLNLNILQVEYDKLGLNVTADEIFDMITGKNPHPSVVQSFTNPNTGQFDAASVLMYIKQLDELDDPDQKKQWLAFERSLREDRYRNKYFDLIRKALYVPKWKAKIAYEEQNRKASIKYLQIPYTSVSDEDVSFTDEELNKYLNANAAKYKQEAFRSIEFVMFEVLPSAEDTATILRNIQDLVLGWKDAQDDSSYVKMNSDGEFSHAYKSLDKIDAGYKDTLFTADTGSFIGPFEEDGAFKVVKVIDRKMVPDSVKVRQILLAATDQATFKKAVASVDSIKLLLENGADFGTLARELSIDQETAFVGGEMGWLKPEEKFEQFNNKLFYTHTEGDIFTQLSSQGVHLVEILEAPPATMGVKYAVLSEPILPSDQTDRGMYAVAQEFAAKNRTAEAFYAAAEADENLLPRSATNIKINDNDIIGLGSARNVVKWIYEKEEKEVSEVLGVNDNYMVAVISAVREEGTKPLEDVRTEIELEVVKEKKTAVIGKRIKDAGGTDIDELADNLSEYVKNASNITWLNPNIAGAGVEPEVAAVALGLEEGEMSRYIKGVNGVYVVQVESFDEPAELDSYDKNRNELMQAYSTNIEFALVGALVKKADLVDNRHKFY